MKWMPLLFWLVAGTAWATGPPVEFSCEPQDAEVYLQEAGAAPRLLGHTNEPLKLDRAHMGERVTLTLRRSGWHDAELVVPRDALEGNHYPAYGSLTMSPDTSLGGRTHQAAYALERNLPWLSVPVLLTLMMGLGRRAIDTRAGGLGSKA